VIRVSTPICGRWQFVEVTEALHFMRTNLRLALIRQRCLFAPLEARNGFFLDVEAKAGYEFISGSMERGEFRFAKILGWIRQR